MNSKIYKLIKYLIIDVDGTLTDGKIYIGDNGELFKAFDVKDGYGIQNIAISYGIEPIIITGRESAILQNRCRELGIKRVFQGVNDKINKLKFITNDFSEVAYIGDDLNDLECMKSIKNARGLIGCPANAVKDVKEISDYISSRDGGNGAVREFIEWIVNSNNDRKS